jgi:hypothetical protein
MTSIRLAGQTQNFTSLSVMHGLCNLVVKLFLSIKLMEQQVMDSLVVRHELRKLLVLQYQCTFKIKCLILAWVLKDPWFI